MLNWKSELAVFGCIKVGVILSDWLVKGHNRLDGLLVFAVFAEGRGVFKDFEEEMVFGK